MNEPPNKPMKLTVAFGARSLSASRWAAGGSMHRNRALVQRCVVALGALGALALAPSRSDACSCDFYEHLGFVTSGGLVPSNSRGLLWLGEFQGEVSAGEIPVQIATASGAAIPVEYELVSKDRDRSLWLFYPKGGFETGKSYVFATKRARRSRGSEVQRVSVVVSKSAAEQPPINSVALSIGKPRTDGLDIAAAMSCSKRVNATQLPIKMELPEALEKFRDQLFFETIIDGSNRWVASDSLCAPMVPGTSWRGKGIDLIYRACDATSGTFFPGLAAGSHTIAMRATLPGTQLRIETAVAEVELQCPDNP